jgi:hypothetical protein
MRLSRSYPLLGHNTPGIVGHQAQDDGETPAPVWASDVGMVSGTPSRTAPRAASHVRGETTGLLLILWYPWQRQDVGRGV